MQAMILAAGMGRRLKELTKDITKGMIEVNGITLIERMLSQLDCLRLSKIVIVVGFQAAKLQAFIETLDVKTPIAYVENRDYFKTNNIYSLYLAREYLRGDDTLLMESDLIFDDCVLQSVVDDPHPSLALVAKYESWMDGAVVTLHDDGVVKDLFGKEQFEFSEIKNYYKTVNIYKFSKHFSHRHYVPFLEAYCYALGNNEYFEQVLKVITKLGKSELKAKILEFGNWYEIDDIQDLDIAESLFVTSDAEKHKRIQNRFGGYWRYPQMLDFSYLVNPFFPPQRLMDEIKANFETLISQYPSGQRVNNLIAAKYFGIDPAVMLVGNGAGELIKSMLGQISGKIGIVIPTFEEYPSRKKDEIIEYRPGSDMFAYTESDLICFFENKQIDALVVINPDNPSGNYIPHEKVLNLVNWAGAEGVKLIIDESFVDFASIKDTLLCDNILYENPHLIVVKSISKSYGVPGLRLGVLACSDKQLIKNIKSDLSIWNINSFAEFYLQIFEKYKYDFARAMQSFYPVRDKFFDDLCSAPFLSPIPSKANYITCELKDGVSALKLSEFLIARHNILVKDLSSKNGVDGEYIRIAVKKPEENARLVQAIKESLLR